LKDKQSQIFAERWAAGRFRQSQRSAANKPAFIYVDLRKLISSKLLSIYATLCQDHVWGARCHHHHHHKHPGLGHLARSVSRVKVALSIVSLVSKLFSFLVGSKGMILKGFGFVAFFAGVKASSFRIRLSCLVCSLSVVRGQWSRLFCSHKRRNLPEVSVASFLPPQFFVSVRLSKSNFLTHTKM
jgi:hypothetical protein